MPPSHSTLAVALKEWDLVITALLEGRHAVLLRKGGLLEADNQFELEHPRFLFFPTFIVLAFFAGRAWDCLIERNLVSEDTTLPLTALLAGIAGVTAIQLTLTGLPGRSL